MKQTCLVVMLATLLCCAQAQTSNPYSNQILKQLTPITPEAAALGKYGSVPVSMYTGIPSISIPLYEINVNGFKLPINLNYHAGGNKVDDIASWVGMGWSLQAGGIITRQQRGVYDERMIDVYPSVKSSVDVIVDPNATDAQKLTAASNLGLANFDTESDIFSFNFPGYSGKFFLDPDGNYYTTPKNDKFTLTFKDQGRYDATPHRGFYARWIIAGNDGIRYVFGRTLDNVKSFVDVSCTGGNSGYSCEDVVTVNSWQLNEIILPGGQRIKFVYEFLSYDVANIPSATSIYSSDPNCYQTSSSGGYIRYSQICRLQEIQYPGGKVTFEAGDPRMDVPGDKFLRRITVAAQDGATYNTIKQYLLTYDNGSRLRLDRIDEISTDNIKKPHQFIYNSTPLPARGSASQDLWGYYNGLPNTELKPAFFIFNNQGGIANSVGNSNRAVNPDFTQAGILKEIIYPTGGSTRFEYENNEVTCRNAYDEASRERVSSYALQNNTLDATEDVVLAATAATATFRFRVEATSPDCSLTNGLWNCLDVQLQQKNPNGTYQVINASLTDATDYTLQPGTYRVQAVWRVPASMRLNLTVRWNGILTDTNPQLCQILDHTYQYPVHEAGSNNMFFKAASVEYGDPFTIPPMPSGVMYLKSQLYGCPSDGGSLITCGMADLERRNADGTYTTVMSNLRNNYTYPFFSGTFRLKFTWYNNSSSGQFGGVTLAWPTSTIPYTLNVARGERLAGGLRIKSITDYDNATQRTVVKTYDYTFTDEDGAALSGVTSGMLMNVPVYWYSYMMCVNGFMCVGDAFTSQSQANILSQDGINVGYAVVTEQVQGLPNAGKEEFRYSTVLDYPDGGVAASTLYPFVNTTSYDWRRGNQLRRKATINNQLSEREDQLYTFNSTTADPNYKKIPCIKISPTPFLEAGPVGSGGACLGGTYQPSIYSLISESFLVSQHRLEKTSTRNAAQSIVANTLTTQDPATLAPARVETNDSRKLVQKTYARYAGNYTLPATLQGAARGIRKLQDFNMQTIPVERYTTETGPDGIEYVIDGSLSVYSPSLPIAEKTYQLTISQPKPLSAFTPSSVLPDGTFQMDPDYIETASFAFNADLTLREQSRTDDAPKAYLWDYAAQYMVASADNATAGEIAYTSFEGTNRGNLSYAGTPTPDNTAITGKRVYDLSTGTITRSSLDANQEYLVSYWYKTGATVTISGGTQTVVRTASLVKGAWSFRQLKITGTTSVSLSGSGLIDEIRILPSQALMTSYTYEPGVGISTATDANNRITYYEYDTFNRLKLVRDHTGKIKDLFQYHYTRQQ